MLKLELSPRMLPAVRGIYLIQNVVTGMRYIGSSNDVRARAIGHARKLITSRHCNRHLQAAWDSDGSDAFRWALIEEVGVVASLASREGFHITLMRSGFGDAGFNLVINPGTGSLAEDVRRRMSQARKGRPAWNKGVPCPEHVKRAIRSHNSIRVRGPEERAKIRLAMLGPAHPHRGKKFSAEVRLKMTRRVRSAGPLSGKFKGVNLDARTQTFMARIYIDGKQIFLGRYKTEIEAAYAYNSAAIQNFGAGCFLNLIEFEPILKRRTIRGRPAREMSHVA